MKRQEDFYEWCLGSDWQDIVQKDTEALLKCARSGDSLFIAPLSSLDSPVLLTGSAEDMMCRSNMEEEYCEMRKLIGNASIHMFKSGSHPAILSNAEEFAAIAKAFIMNHSHIN